MICELLYADFKYEKLSKWGKNSDSEINLGLNPNSNIQLLYIPLSFHHCNIKMEITALTTELQGGLRETATQNAKRNPWHTVGAQ